MRRLNKLSLGLAVGLLLPFLFVLVFFQFMEFPGNFNEFLENSYETKYIWTVLKLAIIVNIIPFLLGLQRNLLKFDRGVMLATFVYAAVIVYFTFIG